MHYPVLLEESVELLNIRPNGIYIDGTFGRGGHTLKILSKLDSEGRLIAFDKDKEAIEFGRNNITDSRLTLIHDSFSEFTKYLESLNITSIDGLLLDLGVSSPQLDDHNRGFSFMQNSTLDMRMNNESGISAKEWINSVSEKELAKVLFEYGEEKFSRKIAKNVIEKRLISPIITTKDLVDIIDKSIPYNEKGKHKSTRSFQAIRIKINNELEDLEKLLEKAPNILKVNARIVIISFHSLEDRIVKQKFLNLSSTNHLPKWVIGSNTLPSFRVIAKKVKASELEIQENKRSRSAILRALERTLIKDKILKE